jgi:mono/diheme cytochrome c family protein
VFGFNVGPVFLGSSIRASILVGVAVLAVSGCGGSDKAADSSSPSSAAGAKVFASAGCGTCHTLSAASAKGTIGPNLDQLKPEQSRVERQVRNGGVGMPSFKTKLSDLQISQVAEYVADETRKATGGGSVAAGFKPDDTTLDDCAAQGEFHCYEQAFANISFKDGPKKALDLFDEKIKTPGPIEADCHRIAHAIGAGALSHYDGNVGQAFVAGRPSCTSGYYHGILERAFLGIDQSQLGGAARKFCADPRIRKVEFIAYQCVHGLGHGLMIYTGYDLPLSLHTCDKLQNQWDATSCTGGVFMENYQSSYGVKSTWLKKNDLLYPCDSVAEKYKFYCYDLVTARILPAVKWNWEKAAKVCRKSERNWVKICFQSFGRDASGFTRLDPARILDICSKADEMAKECIFAAAEDMTYTDVSPRRAKVLCNTAPAKTRDYCWIGIGSILGSLDRDPAKRKARCDEATTEYRRACYQGAVVSG